MPDVPRSHLKIVSDGTVHGTRVYVTDGKDILGSLAVRNVAFKHDLHELPSVTLECLNVSLELDHSAANDLIEVTHLDDKTRRFINGFIEEDLVK